jgi:spermidine synthase
MPAAADDPAAAGAGPPRIASPRLPLLLACFFLSGGAGLLYEVLWTRLLALTFGHTVWAMTTVLSVFMGGLALGSLLLGGLADRHRSPVRLYALLELGIGAFCLAAPLFLDLTRHAYAALSPAFGDAMVPRVLLQVLLSALVLIVPTTLMGGTVPVLVRAVTSDPALAGKRVAVLYAVNTLGAALGAFAAGYWLLPTFGLHATNLSAACLNLAVGGGLLLLPPGGRPPATEAPAFAPPGAGAAAFPVPDRVLLLGFAVSGAVGMSYQIAWVRSLTLVIGNSTYAFSAILVTFLAGIALGSALFSGVRSPTAALFAALQLGIALSAFLLIPVFDLLPDLFLRLFTGFSGDYAYIQSVQFLIVALVVMVPTTLMGMTFPCLTALLSRRGDSIGGDVGRFYAVNTAGAILGSALTGFLLIPLLGAQRTIEAGVVLGLAIAALFLCCAFPARRVIIAPAAALLALSVLLAPRWDPQGAMSMGVSIYPRIFAGLTGKEIAERRAENYRMVFSREGVSSTIGVFARGEEEAYLTVNGKTDASSRDMETQVKLAFIPMMIHPSPGRVAVIGLGSGISAGVAGLFGSARSIDIIELEPAMAEAARFFARENHGILDDPRVRMHFEDGRGFLESRPGPWDVVISEPSNPWIAGVANLFTVEFLETVRRRLAPGGVLCLWIHTYSLAPESYRLVLRTFLDAFPDATLWHAFEGGDTFLLGRTSGGGGGALDIAALEARLDANPQVARAFAGGEITPLDSLLASFLLGPRDLRRFAGPGPLNTDDLNLLEFQAPRALYDADNRRIFLPLIEGRRDEWPPFISDPLLATTAARLYLGEILLRVGSPELASRWFRGAPSLAPPLPPGGGVSLAAGRGVRAPFAGPAAFGLLPATGDPRPGEDAGPARRRALIDLLTRSSGVEMGAGRAGGPGLRLRALPGTGTRYLLPLAVGPGDAFAVRLWMRDGMDAPGETGMRAHELDSPDFGGAEPGTAFDERHLLRSSAPVRETRAGGWREHAFRIEPVAGTRVLLLDLFRDGGTRMDTVEFDGLFIARIPGN